MALRKTWLLASPFILLACGGGNNNNKIEFPCGQVTPVAGDTVQLQAVVDGLANPMYVTGPAGDARLFIVEQAGRIRLFKNGQLVATPYLDISDRVGFDGFPGDERGLLSMAFHPSFADNGKLFVYYTDAGGDIQISEFTAADPNGDAANPASERPLLTIEHSQFGNHNGGLVAFGPDGFLYAGVGDGGSANDPFLAGQDTTTLLGKLLRIDPATGGPVAGNPFNNEIYDFGLRNPWRWSFDRLTGDLYIGDVGQGAREELDFKTAATPPGTNWGWSDMEGDGFCVNDANCNNVAGITRPILDLDHNTGVCSIIGGYVYRGETMPDLSGTYFFTDLCTGIVESIEVVNGDDTNRQDVTAQFGNPQNVVSFGEDGCGEMYVVEIGGAVSKIVPGL